MANALGAATNTHFSNLLLELEYSPKNFYFFAIQGHPSSLIVVPI